MKLILISDSTGITVESLVRAACVQFPDTEFIVDKYPKINTSHKLISLINSTKVQEADAIFYSFVAEDLISIIKGYSKATSIPVVDILSHAIGVLEDITKTKPQHNPGALRVMDDDYFSRVEAIEFAVKYDDGKDPRAIKLADIVIIGVSRTSKTPLSMYLANRNYKVCNIPLVPEVREPQELYEIKPSKIIGLTNSPYILNQIRRTRAHSLGMGEESNYYSLNRISQELEYAHSIFDKLACPVFDVSDMAIEETAELIVSHFKKLERS